MDSIFELEDYINKLKKEDERSYKLFKEFIRSTPKLEPWIWFPQ